jgi:molybdopterin converting factor small subunit
MTPAELPVRVLLFGRYRELAGTGEIRLEVPPGSRVRDVVGLLRAGDEVALIPPVAGG